MRVAALYDIHGNLPALEAVLADVEREGVDAIVIGGDIAAGPPQPREVVELVRSLPNAHVIRGNADRLFAEEYTGDDGLDWLLERLEDDQADWLAGLPFSVVLDDTLYVHAAPDDDRTIVTELTTDEKLAGLLRDVEQRRVVAGHTHMQLERRVGETLFVNAGSVGWPYEGRPARTGRSSTTRSSSGGPTTTSSAPPRLSAPRGIRGRRRVAAENILVSAPRAEALAVFGG